jgi:hypothetical protein
MSAIDYHGIGVEIKTVLDAYFTALGGTPVYVADPGRYPTFDQSGNQDSVYIYLSSRSAPDGVQRIRAGTSTDQILSFAIWSFSFHADDISQAELFRDALLGNVELALMEKRTLNSKVKALWLRGGQFYGADEGGLWSGAETIMECHAQSLTV